jgi:hypothetical protein
MAGKIPDRRYTTMVEYTGHWYWEDEDYEGYRTTPDSYVPGSVAYNWLKWRLAPSIPTGDLMEASEILDEIFSSFDQYNVQFNLPVFRLTAVFDQDILYMIRELALVIRQYLRESVIELVYSYLQFRKPEKFL